MKRHLPSDSVWVAAGILIASSMAFAKSPSPDSGRPSAASAAVERNGRSKSQKSRPSQSLDAIDVVGHLALAGEPVTRFVCTTHCSSDYIYAEHGAGQDITLIDVTNAEHPSVVGEVPVASGGGGEDLVSAAGTAALVSTEQSIPGVASKSQTLRIMDLSDPQHPKIAREIDGVTAIGRDENRGLVFLANCAGIWILHERLAEDPEVEAEYTRYVLYDP